jgi:hypothetical protein
MHVNRSGRLWIGRVVAALALAGLAVYLASVGVSRASVLASIFGVLIAAVALVAPYLLPPRSSSSGTPPRQSVINSAIGGHVAQVRHTGNVRVRRPTGTSPPPATAPTGDSAANGVGAQLVDGSWTVGNVVQADTVDGEVVVE